VLAEARLGSVQAERAKLIFLALVVWLAQLTTATAKDRTRQRVPAFARVDLNLQAAAGADFSTTP
jgi:hypothetical protein